MKLLFVSNLYPDATEPQRGLYNARLVRHLGELCEVRVVSPRPAWPLCPGPRRAARAEDARFAPCFPPGWYLPKIGSRFNPALMAASLRPILRRLRREWPFDLALASWVYPDGCAVARLAGELGFPFGAVAQGTDVHQYLAHPIRRRLIVDALNRARVVIARSGELSRLLREAGVDAGRLRVIYNGVDTTVFQPGDRLAARRQLGWPAAGAVVLFVGNLLPIKNPLLAVAAVGELKARKPPGARLVMVGDGPLRDRVSQTAREQGVEVVLPGAKPAAEVALCLQAADVLCVSSDNEGLPNVLLEALACGLPVAATRVGGIPEILTSPEAGRLAPPGDAAALAEAIAQVLAEAPSPAAVSRSAERFSWPSTARAYFEALRGENGN